MDLELFLEILGIDSTSSTEGEIASFFEKRFATDKCSVSKFDVGDGTVNLLFSWGDPQIVFCTHMDTVPPFFPPSVVPSNDGSGDIMICGRGSCDAKGQIFSMYNACLELEKKGETGFGLLLLAGEEAGSLGAKSFRNAHPGGRFVIVGEPTDNKIVSASKGTKSFGVTIKGKSFHSGYPVYGASAVERFIDMMNVLRAVEFPMCPRLGETTWNVGKLISDNPQNILSDLLTFRIYFRTTFTSDKMVCELMERFADEYIEVVPYGGDTPAEYLTLDGFDTKTVAFGSDAPQLTNFSTRLLCGPGSILVAHTSSEYIMWNDMRRAVDNYVRMFSILKGRI